MFFFALANFRGAGPHKICTKISMPASRHVTWTSFVRLLPLETDIPPRTFPTQTFPPGFRVPRTFSPDQKQCQASAELHATPKATPPLKLPRSELAQQLTAVHETIEIDSMRGMAHTVRSV